MENTRQAILSTKDVDIESGDYVVVPIGDENELWFTQTHFAEIRELMMLSEEMKSSRQVTSISADADDENAKSGLSVYAGYIGKTIRRRDGFEGTVTDVTTNGDYSYVEVHVTGGKDAGKNMKIQLSFILKNKGVYSITDEITKRK